MKGTEMYEVTCRSTDGPETYGYQDTDAPVVLSMHDRLQGALNAAKREADEQQVLVTIYQRGSDEPVYYVSPRGVEKA